MSDTVPSKIVLLMHGYVRSNYKTNKIVPTVIIELLNNFYNGLIQWTASEKLPKNWGWLYELQREGPSVNIFGIPLQIAMEPSRYYSRKLRLEVNMDPMQIENKNITNFVCSISIKNAEIYRQFSWNGRWAKNCNDLSRYKIRQWVIVPAIDDESGLLKFRDLDESDDEVMAVINVEFSMDLLDINFFKMNTINDINWCGMESKCAFKDDKFDMFWEKVDPFMNVMMAVKLISFPFWIKDVRMRCEFKDNDGKVLCKQEKDLKRNDNGSIKHIMLTCDGSDFIDATILTITVVRLTDSFQHEIPTNEWIQYGFIKP